MTRSSRRGVMLGVGSVDHRSVRLWLRVPEYRGELEVRLEPEHGGEALGGRFAQRGDEATDWTMSVRYPDDFDSAPKLESRTRYRFQVLTADGEEVGEGGFDTAPRPDHSGPLSFAFGFMSCHQPFGEDGEVVPEAGRMLEILEPTLRRHEVRYLLMIGDQMYSDQPQEKSLFDEDHFRSVARHGEESILDCDEEEILHHYHRRYRQVWGEPGFGELQRRRATFWILDDHEIVDNWGAAEAHSEPGWQRLGRAARRAFHHYQAAHALPADREPPDSFHQELRWGPTATFITDMRSARALGAARDRIFGEEQFGDLERFLDSNAERDVVFIVLTVPPLPLPKPLIRAAELLTDDGSDADDRWESSVRVADRDRFLRLLHDHQRRHPQQKVVLLSGDVHLACALEVRWIDEETPPFLQLVSSGVTNVLGLVDSALVKGVSALLPKIDLDGPRLAADFVGGEGENPFSGLNFGIVEVRRDDEGTTVRFRVVTPGGEDDDGGLGVVAFDSGEI